MKRGLRLTCLAACCFTAASFAQAELLFVTDASRGNIMKFDTDTGQYKGIISGLTGSGEYLADVDQAPDGNLYALVTNFSTTRIVRLDPYTGLYKGALANGFLTGAYGMAIGADGTIYVADSTNGIMRFNSSDGQYKGIFGAGFGSYNYYDNIAIGPDGNAYVASNGTPRTILRFDPVTGQYKGSLGSGFVSTSAYYYSIEVAPDGNLYVVTGDETGQGTANVLRFDCVTGQYKGMLAHGFYQSTVAGIAMSAAGELYCGMNTSVSQWCAMRFVGTTGQYKGYLGFGFPSYITGMAAEQPATITGHINLSYWGAATTGKPIQWEVRAVGGSTVLESGTTTLDASSNYSFTTFQRNGNFDIYLKGALWLKKRVGNTAIGLSGATGVNATLINGDCNNDNAVDASDYFILSDAYDSFSGDPSWDPRADLNGDLAVDSSDYFILSDSYDFFGDD